MPARIGIMGQSYGGFMVNAAITEHPELWRAAVNYYGIADFVTLLAGTGAWRRNHRAAEYGDPERDAALFARISPIHRVERVQRAGAAGARDARSARAVWRERAVRRCAGGAAEAGDVPDSFDYAGHGFIRPDDRARIFRAVAEFFTAHLA